MARKLPSALITSAILAGLAATQIISPAAVSATEEAPKSQSRGLARIDPPAQAAAAPNIYGLVIGIDQYNAPWLRLGGAVNDAKVVAQALRAVNAKEVVEIIDGQATRDNISQAWNAIAAKAQPGDIVVFSYSGHGSQSDERVPGSEADGKDEFFVLAGYGPEGQANYERIVDDDLQEWFSKVPHLNVVLVADSCHSGTMTRAYQQSKLKSRSARMGPIVNDSLPPPNPAVVDEQKNPLPHVVALSAVADDEEDQEIPIDNQSHGALSWYFAQGLHGSADSDHDGKITAVELKDYLYENIKNQTSGQQHPQLRVADTGKVLAKLPASADAAGKAPPPAAAPLLAFSFSPGDASLDANSLASQLKGIQLAEPQMAQLEWDTQQNLIKNSYNDVVYRLKPVAEQPKTKDFKRVKLGLDPKLQAAASQVQAVIDKFLLVEKLQKRVDGSMGLSLQPNDKLHKNGERVSLVAERMKYPFFTLINLASDGSVNFLYPSEATDPPSLPAGQPYSLSLDVSPPFGADHFIAIASAAPLESLHQFLKSPDAPQRDLDKFWQALQTSLEGVNYQMSMHATFTTD
jgi:uncharacterized caspase-like protein